MTAAGQMAEWLNVNGVGVVVGLLIVLVAVDVALAWFERAGRLVED
jgi:hypothetical protein